MPKRSMYRSEPITEDELLPLERPPRKRPVKKRKPKLTGTAKERFVKSRTTKKPKPKK